MKKWDDDNFSFKDCISFLKHDPGPKSQMKCPEKVPIIKFTLLIVCDSIHWTVHKLSFNLFLFSSIHAWGGGPPAILQLLLYQTINIILSSIFLNSIVLSTFINKYLKSYIPFKRVIFPVCLCVLYTWFRWTSPNPFKFCPNKNYIHLLIVCQPIWFLFL